MENKLGVNVVYCKVSGFKLVAYTDFNGLLVSEAVHPVFNCELGRLWNYIKDNQQLNSKEEVLVGLWPLHFVSAQFKCAADIDSTGALKLVHKARTLISRLRKLYAYNSEIRQSIKNSSSYRQSTQQNKNLLIQRADLIKQFMLEIPRFVINEDNKSDIAAINNYYAILINVINSLINCETTRKQISAEVMLREQNNELDRIFARRKMLASGNFKLRDAHYTYLAAELGEYLKVQGKFLDIGAMADKIKNCLRVDVKIEKLDRAFFMKFAAVAKQVLADSSDAISQEAEDADFIVRRIEQVESELNSLQGLLGGELFETNKVVNGVEYKILVTGAEGTNAKAVLNEAMAAPTAQAKLADAINRAKALLAAKKR